MRVATDALVLFESKAGRQVDWIERLLSVNAREMSAESKQALRSSLTERADSGDMAACCLLSRELSAGTFAGEDKLASFLYAERAAKRQYPPAHYHLGICYEFGFGTGVDLLKALAAYETSAGGGYTSAMLRLGIALRDGSLGVLDQPLSNSLLEQAATLGDAHAAYELARVLETQDAETPAALYWYKRASELGHSFASSRLAVAYARGELSASVNPSVSCAYQDLADRQ